MSDGGKYSFPSLRFLQKRENIYSLTRREHREKSEGPTISHTTPWTICLQAAAQPAIHIWSSSVRLSCLGWNWSESWSELGENSWREWVFIYWLHQSKDTGELLSACFSLLHRLRKNGSEHIFKRIGRKQLLERKSFQLQEPELTRATWCLRRRRHREKIHRGPRAFPHLPWEEKTPRPQSKQGRCFCWLAGTWRV